MKESFCNDRVCLGRVEQPITELAIASGSGDFGGSDRRLSAYDQLAFFKGIFSGESDYRAGG